MSLPTVSIIMPCRNEEAFIEDCINSILDNDYPQDHLDIHVIDGQSNDRTREILEKIRKRHPVLRISENPNQTIPSAMNIGLCSASGEIIMKMDAHALYAKDYIRRCVQGLLESGADNVGGIIKTVPRNQNFLGRAIVSTLSNRFGVGLSHFRIGADKQRWVDTVFTGCYRREIFDRVGGYDENISRSEDLLFNKKILKSGGRILLIPDIVTLYFARSKLSEFLRHNLNNGYWTTYPLKFGISLFSIRHLIPLAFITSLIAGGGLIWLTRGSPWSALVTNLFRAEVFIYIGLSIFFSIQVALREKNPLFVFIMPFLFFSLHAAYGIGSLIGLTLIFLPKKARAIS